MLSPDNPPLGVSECIPHTVCTSVHITTLHTEHYTMTLVALSMPTPTYDPKVGWSRLVSVAGGTFPTYEEFIARFYTVCAESDNLFHFEDDSVVGTCDLTCEQLWLLLTDMYSNHVHEDNSQEACARWEHTYSWCSSVLGILGWEWM